MDFRANPREVGLPVSWNPVFNPLVHFPEFLKDCGVLGFVHFSLFLFYSKREIAVNTRHSWRFFNLVPGNKSVDCFLKCVFYALSELFTLHESFSIVEQFNRRWSLRDSKSAFLKSHTNLHGELISLAEQQKLK